MPKSKKPKKITPKNAPLRLLDLPTELQTKILEYHYADSQPDLRGYNPTTKTFKFNGIPNLHLEQTCLQVSVDTRKVKNSVMSKELKTSTPEAVGKSRMRDFCMLDRYSWIRQHIGSLDIFTLEPHDPSNWKLLVSSCPRLQDVSIEVFPRYIESEFPEEMDDKELVGYFLESALEGEYDDMAIELIDEMDTGRLMRALGTRQDDPRALVRVHIVKLFVSQEMDCEEPCIELEISIGISRHGPEIVSRLCQSKYACGYQAPDMEQPQIETNPEETTASMKMTRMALLVRAELRRQRLGSRTGRYRR